MEYDPPYREFLKTVENHELTILHDEGIYRHIRFGKPGSSVMSCHIVTFPGKLVVAGDMGDYVFSRLQDMFDFFLNEPGKISPDYWGEKCVASGHEGIKEFSAESLYEVMVEVNAERDEPWNEDELRGLLNQGSFDRAIEYMDVFLDEVHGGEYYNSAHVHTYHFIWCLYAIVEVINRYNKIKEGEGAE